MLSSLRHSALLATMAILGSGAAPIVMANQPAMISTAPRPVKADQRRMTAGAATASRYGSKGAGVSMAQQQRAATKKRRVARNRAAHR